MIKRILLAALLLASGSAHAQLLTKFGPVNGVLVGSSTSNPQTSAATSTNIIGLWSGCSGTNFLRGDGTCATPAGTGVTSVGLTVPSWYTVTGSPVTSSGTLAVTAATGQAANLFLATPNGTTGAISERAIVLADVPPINLGSTANGGILSTSILPSTNGGTSNGFFSVTGPATSTRTFTFPNASATVLTTNAAVTVAQGGTGLATIPVHGVLLGEGTSNIGNVAAMSLDTLLQGQGTGTDPAAVSINNCGSSTTALSYSTSTHTFGCQTITVGGTGTVTSISPGTGITTSPNPIVSTGTVSIDQTAALNWTGLQTFSHTPTSSLGGNILLSASSNPILGFTQTSSGTNAKVWDMLPVGSEFEIRTADDTGANNHVAVDINRGTTNVANIALGNTADSTTVSIPGGAVRMVAGLTSMATGTATTVASVAAGGGAYLFDCGYGSGSSAPTAMSSAAAIGNTLTSTTMITNGSVAATVSGLNFQCTQTSGSTQGVNWGVLKIGF
jgi:hypothetical protein